MQHISSYLGDSFPAYLLANLYLALFVAVGVVVISRRASV